ncbi:radical SAM protein [bacterium]|nr:radical SAM protein [bacterium]
MEKILYKQNLNKNAKCNIWCAYPACYSFAMSSLGYLWIFKSIDENENVNVERIYTDSKLTKLQINEIDAICFSFSFDMDFVGIFQILEKYNIPLKSSERNENHPLIFGGGPVLTANPVPYKEIFDFMVIGDGEVINSKAIEIISSMKGLKKTEILAKIAEIEGIYVPAVYQEKIIKHCVKIEECVYTPILSDEAFFRNMFIMELSRGCANCCSFCMASYMNLPVRFAPLENIIETIDLGLKYTNKIALLGAQVTAHPKFKQICEYIYSKIQSCPEIEMSISSLRVDGVDDCIVKTLAAGHQKHVTIAIEAGSERLRKVINKNVSEEQIFKTVETIRKNGLKGVKIYAMIGIPTENKADLDEIISLAKRIKQANKGFDISFAFSSFIPKPNTPLQWHGRFETAELENRQQYLKKEFHKIGVKASFSSIKWDYWQAVLSRGDGNFTDFLIDVYKSGAKLGAYKKACKNRFNPDDYAIRNYNLSEKLPWDFIEVHPGKEVLADRYKKIFDLI